MMPCQVDCKFKNALVTEARTLAYDNYSSLVLQATPFGEEGSGHTATIKLLPRQKHDVAN